MRQISKRERETMKTCEQRIEIKKKKSMGKYLKRKKDMRVMRELLEIKLSPTKSPGR